jgi:hypothetical protein
MEITNGRIFLTIGVLRRKPSQEIFFPLFRLRDSNGNSHNNGNDNDLVVR